jgi:hypothetical protein
MATLEFYLTGDQLGFYSSVSVTGKSNGTKVTLDGVSSFGDATDVYRIVVEDAEPGATGFTAGQTVTIYSYPDETEVYSGYYPDTSLYNGRASSDTHLMLDNGDGSGVVINLNGVTEGSMQFGPGAKVPLGVELPFTSLPPTPPTFPCLAKGTLVETDIGPLPIETLRIGDKVATFDNGLQKIKWIGKREVEATGLDAPIVFEPGALGNYRRLTVSPQHRMVMNDWRTEMYFGQPEVLVAAVHLVNGTTIRQVSQPKITWYHMLFERHEIIFAEGIRTESLHLGAEALGRLDPVSRAQILALYPEGRLPNTPTARPCLKAYETALVPAERKTGLRSSAA